jgi:hypothetical protein
MHQHADHRAALALTPIRARAGSFSTTPASGRISRSQL